LPKISHTSPPSSLTSAQLNVPKEGARKIYHGRHGARGRRVGQGCTMMSTELLDLQR
jgi:hypothetical protein